jgi:uncharacterized protein YndB with AHSA1/START domain
MSELKVTAPENEPLIVMTRILAAPRKLVWKAWTDPVHVAQWWGPRGITTKIVKLDLRPGGTWRFEHHMPDGSSYAFKGIYLEVVEPEKLVNTFGMEGMFEDKLLVETHTFEEENGRTHYKSVSRFDTIEDRDGMLASGMETGARESMDRLDELLATF